MNNHKPLMMQGPTLGQKDKGRARVKIAVFFVLAIHGIGLMALLMQGCGQSKEPDTPVDTTASNPPPGFVEPTNPPVTTSNPSVVVAPTPVVETPPPQAVPPAASEYTIVKGDVLENVAKKFHVSVKAIIDANPGIQPTKLQIGQKIQIPAPAAPTAPTPAASLPPETASVGGEQLYTVKSGDTLIGIAKQFGTTPKAISAANNLTTTRINVGQKLKIPASPTAPAVVPSPPVEPAPTAPTSSPPTAPPGR